MLLVTCGAVAETAELQLADRAKLFKSGTIRSISYTISKEYMTGYIVSVSRRSSEHTCESNFPSCDLVRLVRHA